MWQLKEPSKPKCICAHTQFITAEHMANILTHVSRARKTNRARAARGSGPSTGAAGARGPVAGRVGRGAGGRGPQELGRESPCAAPARPPRRSPAGPPRPQSLACTPASSRGLPPRSRAPGEPQLARAAGKGVRSENAVGPPSRHGARPAAPHTVGLAPSAPRASAAAAHQNAPQRGAARGPRPGLGSIADPTSLCSRALRGSRAPPGPRERPSLQLLGTRLCNPVAWAQAAGGQTLGVVSRPPSSPRVLRLGAGDGVH